jgi:hypothetical protein
MIHNPQSFSMMVLAMKPTMPKDKTKNKHDGAGLPGLRFPGNLADDEEHEEHEGTDPEGHAKIRNLLFRQPEHRRRAP